VRFSPSIHPHFYVFVTILDKTVIFTFLKVAKVANREIKAICSRPPPPLHPLRIITLLIIRLQFYLKSNISHDFFLAVFRDGKGFFTVFDEGLGMGG
jgi:hypothetical protein